MLGGTRQVGFSLNPFQTQGPVNPFASVNSTPQATWNKITKPMNENLDKEKMKKEQYREQLLTQMEINRINRGENVKLKMLEDAREEERLAKERENIDKINGQDNYVRKRKDALDQAKETPIKGSKSVDIRTPGSKRYDEGPGTPGKGNVYSSIRDEFARDPKRRKNVVEANWLDHP
mmetsp:Transcript_7591/g.6951  ORF Transcript_7591/g.6951 Transcript_7591/m.6951 type:complete len:177 (+) Transcript_7591:197-727(+)